MNGAIDLSITQMISAYVFVIILLVFVKLRKMSKEKEILIASIRMTLQLILVGYILIYLFENMSPLYTVLTIIIMEVFAIFNIFKRTNIQQSTNLKKIVALSMVLGTGISIVYFLFIVIRVTPWYNAQYFIPISGMVIGNSMTGISLGVSRLVDGMKTERHLVETALMLGATPRKASKRIVDHAFNSAILPTINSMMGTGIVFLPGMMTGQILSGTSPLTAIEYQIAILLGILGSVSLTCIVFVELGYRTFFNNESQLIIE